MTHSAPPYYPPNRIEAQPEAMQEFLVEKGFPTEQESAALTDSIEAIAEECANSGAPVVILGGGT